MSIITAKGSQAKENANKKSKVDTSKIYLRLKENQTHKVRVLGVEDYVEYESRGEYNLGIYNQAVTPNSPLKVAHEKGGEKFNPLYAKKRYVFVFGSLQTGELVAWDASKNQAKSMISTIEDYNEQDVLDEVGFTLKRTGEKTETVYSLNPIMKMKPEDQGAFDAFNDTTVEMDFFEDIIQPKDDKFLAKLLKEAGFDVATHLPHIELDEGQENGSDEGVEPITAGADDEGLLDTI